MTRGAPKSTLSYLWIAGNMFRRRNWELAGWFRTTILFPRARGRRKSFPQSVQQRKPPAQGIFALPHFLDPRCWWIRSTSCLLDASSRAKNCLDWAKMCDLLPHFNSKSENCYEHDMTYGMSNRGAKKNVPFVYLTCWFWTTFFQSSWSSLWPERFFTNSSASSIDNRSKFAFLAICFTASPSSAGFSFMTRYSWMSNSDYLILWLTSFSSGFVFSSFWWVYSAHRAYLVP